MSSDAGDFSDWLERFRQALTTGATSDVPCRGCQACCESAQFVHIEPNETETLAHVPQQWLAPAPNRPPGHVVLGYDEQGRCPMLGDNGCTIYDHRPRACRVYDCRVFAAAGVEPAQSKVAERTKTWRFRTRSDDERATKKEIEADAASLLGDGCGPTEAAVRSVADRRARAGS